MNRQNKIFQMHSINQYHKIISPSGVSGDVLTNVVHLTPFIPEGLFYWVSRLTSPRNLQEKKIQISWRSYGSRTTKTIDPYQQHQYPKVEAMTTGCQPLTLKYLLMNRDILACLESGKVFLSL